MIFYNNWESIWLELRNAFEQPHGFNPMVGNRLARPNLEGNVRFLIESESAEHREWIFFFFWYIQFLFLSVSLIDYMFGCYLCFCMLIVPILIPTSDARSQWVIASFPLEKRLHLLPFYYFSPSIINLVPSQMDNSSGSACSRLITNSNTKINSKISLIVCFLILFLKPNTVFFVSPPRHSSFLIDLVTCTSIPTRCLFCRNIKKTRSSFVYNLWLILEKRNPPSLNV